MFLTAAQSDEGYSIGIGLSENELTELRGGLVVKFRLSRVGVPGRLGERLAVVTFETDEVRRWRESRTVPKDYAVVSCIQGATLTRLRAGGYTRMPRDRNGLELYLFSPDNAERCKEVMDQAKVKWPS